MVNASGGTLIFTFTIGVSLWRYDNFVLGFDSQWTVATGAACASIQTAGRVNNFNGTNTASLNSLQCVVAGSKVYIYGLAVDGIDLTATTDNQYVKLSVTSITNPPYVGGTYSGFSASTYRFGTYTMLETGNAATVPTVTAGTIVSTTWTQTWGLAATSMLAGSNYFMDMSVTTLNRFPLLAQS